MRAGVEGVMNDHHIITHPRTGEGALLARAHEMRRAGEGVVTPQVKVPTGSDILGARIAPNLDIWSSMTENWTEINT